MVSAASTPKRDPESGIYQFRRRVPEQLKAIVGKSEIKFSLQTRDPVSARILHLEAAARLEREWAQLKGVAIETPVAIPVSPDFRPSAPASLLALVAPHGVTSATTSSPAAPPSASASGQSAEAKTAVPARVSVPMRRTFESYSKEAELAPSTVKRWTPAVDRLVGFLGHEDAAAISRADIVAWKDSLIEAGMKTVTVRDVYVAGARAILQYAVDQGDLAENPAAGVKVRVRKAPQQRDKGFDGNEAETILSATKLKFSDKISVEMAAARRWVPWLGAYSGARVNELTPLTGRDIVVRDGIVMMRIRAENNKTREFREVPLHSHIIEQGFLDYVKSRGARPLFYDPARSRGGKASNPHHKKVGERLAEWVRSLGIDERVAPNHGWRHRFSTVSRFVGMPEDVRNIIQGHAGTKVADSYGDTWPLVALREIEKLPRYAV